MSRRRWLSGRKAITIIAHGETNRSKLEPQLDEYMPGTTVLHRVGDGLLPNAEQVHLYRRGESNRAAQNLEVGFRLLARNEGLDDLR